MIPIALVVAAAENGVIGIEGRMPWRIAEDMRHFKAITIGKPCIMGRKTWESLPRKPLPGRTNIVVTRDPDFAAAGACVVRTPDEALKRAAGENPPEIAVIGGAEIYKALLPRARRIYLTEIHSAFEGDAIFDLPDNRIWREVSREPRTTPEGLGYSYVTLERRT